LTLCPQLDDVKRTRRGGKKEKKGKEKERALETKKRVDIPTMNGAQLAYNCAQSNMGETNS